jgi:hypothetical protein
MPVIINPKNMKEREEEREKEEKLHPEITVAKWGKGTVKEGEKVEMVAQVKDIGEGNMVTFQIWKEGQDPAAHIAQRQVPARIEGGVAKGEWEYWLADIGEFGIPEEDPKFYFTAHSAWCRYKESGKVTVELKRAELSEPEWADQEGKSTDKGLVGEVLKMTVFCNEDMEEGAGVTFRVYEKGADPKRDYPVFEAGSQNKGGKAEAEWTPVETREAGDMSELTYFFTVSTFRAKAVTGSNITVKNPQILEMNWDPSFIYHEQKATLKITTFEVSSFSPEVTVRLRSRGEKDTEKYILEQTVCLDQDEKEIEFEISYALDKFPDLHGKVDYELATEIVCDSIKIQPGNQTYLIVGIDNAYK